MFASFDRAVRLFERLPATFTAEDVGRTGLTGSRRHMLVRHYAEHPAFDCALIARNPLTVEKTAGEAADEVGTGVDEEAGEESIMTAD